MKLTKLAFPVLLALFLVPILANGQPSVNIGRTIEISPQRVIVPNEECPEGCRCSGEGEVVACPLGPSCETPCNKSGDTCVCPMPEPPRKICISHVDNQGCAIVECTDGASTKTCPTAECLSPCVKSGDTCACPAETYPGGCVFSGNTLACPTTGIKPIEAKISSASGIKAVSIEKTQDALSIKTDKAAATTTGNLIIEEEKLALETSAGNKEIKVLPEEASAKALITTVNKIELKEEAQKPVYLVEGTKQAKILFLIPVKLKIETKVDAETGNVISVKKPWYGFLAW